MLNFGVDIYIMHACLIAYAGFALAVIQNKLISLYILMY